MLATARSVRLAVIALALASALAARLVEHFALRDVPHVMDEIAYVLEAKLMATGHVTGPVALPRAAFNMWFVDDRAARFGIFPPGWPALLAVGVRVGLTCWINPLVHLATVIVVGRAGARIGGPRLELGAALLYAASPQAVLLAASLMSHALVALAASIVTLAMATLLEQPRPRRSTFISAGVALGIAVVTRPLCAVVLALPFFAFAVLRAPRLAPLAAAIVTPFLAALGAFNRALTGSALRFPQSAYFDEHIAPANVPFFTYGKGCNALGFGAACDHTVRGAVHSLASAVSDAGDNLRAWSLLVAGPVLFLGVGVALARARTRRVARWLALPSFLAVGLYGLYWQAGVCYGARFYHAALPALVVLVALGIGSLPKPARARGGDDTEPSSESPRPIGSRFAFRAALVAALLFDAGGFVVSLRELTSWSWWGTDDRFAELERHWHDGRAVVMVAFGPDDVKNPPLFATAAAESGTWLLGIRALGALARNPPRMEEADVVFAKFHPALVGELAARFPDRKLWVYTAWADRTKDVLEPWSSERFAGHAYRRPADNFDGFRVTRPYELPPTILREPTDEGWPP